MGNENEKFKLGIKFSIKAEKNRDKESIRLKNTEDGRDAYYNLDLVSTSYNTYAVMLHYGRSGTSGSSEKRVFSDRETAMKFLNKKRGEKIKRGYKEIVTISKAK